MANVTVIGAQWGDEGKGKVIDWLANRAEVVVRFQGGNNAGHTIVVGNKTYKLSLLPSGVIQGKLSIIGNGVVVDVWSLLDEIERAQGQGLAITPDNLVVAENATLVLPLHRDLDGAREARAGAGKIGTTGRGIGPAYEDKVGRRAIRFADLADREALEVKIERLLAHHGALRAGLGLPEITPAEVLAQLEAVAPKILPYVKPAWRVLGDAIRDGQRVLFEGAQATLLDVDHGTYPYVTSSNTVAGQAAAGEGPFPTELHDESGRLIVELGHEFGTVTGRPRRCGWFDAVLVRQSVAVGGLQGEVLNKLDILDGFETLKVCVGYRLNGATIDYLPAGLRDQAAIEPIYEEMEGWSESTRGARSWKDLPANAVKYVRRIEELIGAPAVLLSTSPDRDDIVMMLDPFQG